jgi:uncharacterized protein (TIGR01777 family)
MSKTLSILMSGSNGLIGSELSKYLKNKGHHITRLVREETKDPYTIVWNPKVGFKRENQNLENFDAVIHLAGANIAEHRWTSEYKKEIRDSRVISTEILSEAFALSKRKPKVFICASSIGIYGNHGNEELNEESQKTSSFLADVTKDWEEATRPVRAEEVRVVNLRTGIVLHKSGGALSKMLPLFKFGLGGKLGDGSQYMSWISLEDHIRAVEFILENEEIDGPINLTSPTPITNSEFTKVLAKALGRPAFFPAPAFILNFFLGEMAQELLLTSARVLPKKLNHFGFKFKNSDLKECLIKTLK